MPKLPDFLGHYQRTRFIHAGSCTQIWRAVKSDGRGRCVLKILSGQHWGNRQAIAGLRRKYEVAHSLEHTGIIGVLDFRIEHKIPFLALELFSDRNVKTILREEGPDRVLQLLPQIVVQGATALHFLHEKGWVHCNVKPENFLLNDKAQLKLIDFAIAQRAKKGKRASLLHKHGQVRGTRSYMSPEQIHGQALDGRSDIYSLGCVLFELYAGRVPYTGKNPSDVLNKHLKAAIPSVQVHNHSVPDAVASLIARMMSKEPQHRPGTMVEVLSEFRAALGGSAGQTGAALVGAADGRPPSGNRGRGAAAASTQSHSDQVTAEDAEPSALPAGMMGGSAGSSSTGLLAFASEATKLSGTQLKEAAQARAQRRYRRSESRAVRLLESRVVQVCLAVLVVGLVVLWLMRPPPPGWEQGVHEQFTWVYHRIRQTRQSEASPEVWSQLEAEADAVVEDTAAKLRREATERDRIFTSWSRPACCCPGPCRRHKLRVARYHALKNGWRIIWKTRSSNSSSAAQERVSRPGVWRASLESPGDCSEVTCSSGPWWSSTCWRVCGFCGCCCAVDANSPWKSPRRRNPKGL